MEGGVPQHAGAARAPCRPTPPGFSPLSRGQADPAGAPRPSRPVPHGETRLGPNPDLEAQGTARTYLSTASRPGSRGQHHPGAGPGQGRRRGSSSSLSSPPAAPEVGGDVGGACRRPLPFTGCESSACSRRRVARVGVGIGRRHFGRCALTLLTRSCAKLVEAGICVKS